MTIVQLMASISIVLSAIIVYLCAQDRNAAGIAFGLIIFVVDAFIFLHG